ncbi:MAG: hypothetical protein R6X02_17640 [Enhygromyxa sp.]
MSRLSRLPIPTILAALAAALALGCGPSADNSRPTKIEPASQPAEDANEDAPPKQPLRAAGLELSVPADWSILAEDEPNFALAYGPEERSPHIPVCTIELRRQGPGAKPEGVRELDDGIYEYQRGSLRGRVRTLAGPQNSSIVVHCRAPRSSRQWQAISDILASQVETGAAIELPPPQPTPKGDAIVELCVGSPARMTMACARRADGSVYCGSTTGEALTRVSLPAPAVQISCMGRSACARDAAGKLRCWERDASPEPLVGITAARDIVGPLVVDAAGKLLRRGPSGLTELAPLDDPAHALTGVERVLEGSNAAWGCVLREAELWCWDREGVLPVELAEDAAPQRVAAAPDASALRRMGDRLCMQIGERWTCTEADGRRHELDGCEARACGCSLIGATRLSCEHEPHSSIDARPLGRVSDVVVVAEPCAARADGVVVCRGPIAGRPGEDPRSARAIVSDLPGIAHVLELRDDGDHR